MIIVSQDKEEIINFDNCINITIETNPFEIEEKKEFMILATTNDYQSRIATYRTKERAKEILEEIVKCETGMFAVTYDYPMLDGEKIKRARMNKTMLDKLNNIVIDNGGEIKTLQATKVYYMPEE